MLLTLSVINYEVAGISILPSWLQICWFIRFWDRIRKLVTGRL